MLRFIFIIKHTDFYIMKMMNKNFRPLDDLFLILLKIEEEEFGRDDDMEDNNDIDNDNSRHKQQRSSNPMLKVKLRLFRF